MMEQLKYIIEDKTIAEILGKENFTSDESAILEIVKNSYDAQANEIELVFNSNEIIIKDDGTGMDENDIRNKWMHIGESEKGYKTKDNKRVLSGSKGIGRFALAKLGREVEMYTFKNGIEYLWQTDWNKSELAIVNKHIVEQGTYFCIKNTFTYWTKNKVNGLIKYLSKSYKDDSMKIRIKCKDIDAVIDTYYTENIPGKNCQTKINLTYRKENMELIVDIESDEFTEEATNYYKEESINKKILKLNMLDELSTNYEVYDDENPKHILNELGDFKCEFAFCIKPTKEECEKFLYKYNGFNDGQKHGIALYRNAFSISSYEGEKDWLELTKRYRKSPAAATHKSGSWRVRENQLSGFVSIDKNENKNLIDLSNRQGLVENEFYDVFIFIIHRGIESFERYRQAIIRAINVKNSIEDEIKTETISIIKKSKNDNLVLTNEMKESLLDEINRIEENRKKIKNKTKENERKYIYDVKILNSLATNGLKASSIGHELKNDKNNLSKNIDLIIKKLKKEKMWDILNNSNNTELFYQNVPALLKTNERINKKTISFINTMLLEIEKKQFVNFSININDLLNKIKAEWESEYSWVKISQNVKSDINCYISESDLRVIFDNLILNSVQQNENVDALEVSIDCKDNSNELYFTYSDNGVGLHKKYANNPERILEVHETTRKNGHGLGMWIVNNTIQSTKGYIDKITSNNGFKIEFVIGDIKNDE